VEHTDRFIVLEEYDAITSHCLGDALGRLKARPSDQAKSLADLSVQVSGIQAVVAVEDDRLAGGIRPHVCMRCGVQCRFPVGLELKDAVTIHGADVADDSLLVA